MIRDTIGTLLSLRYVLRGYQAASKVAKITDGNASDDDNPIRRIFESIADGPGVWKWNHYFPAYHRHLKKFVGQEVHIAEVGIYSGGSLRMWQEYFGCRSTIHGIDVQPACKQYGNKDIIIHIGDQGDRSFWNGFRADVPILHAFIDDGSHQAEHQITTLEEILPHLQPGGVYICEDVIGQRNRFAAYVYGLVNGLNQFDVKEESCAEPTPIQRSIASISFYPFCTVIEKHAFALRELRAPRRGTDWQPFLSCKPRPR